MSIVQLTPPIHPMTPVGPSDILRRVRANLIGDSMGSYEFTMHKVIGLINDYIGEDEVQERAISQNRIRYSPQNLFLLEVQQYKKKRMMTVEDRRYAIDWVRTVVASQIKHSKLLPTIKLVPGDSQGITFLIRKENKIYGFLYGTMHNFSSGLKEAEILTELSFNTQVRLLNCSMLGTEITVRDEPRFNSTEGALMAVADACGIANIGIDDSTCDRDSIQTTSYAVTRETQDLLPTKREEPKFKELDHIEELAHYFKGAKDERTLHRITTIALYSGIIELAWSATLSRSSIREDEFQTHLQRQRNQSMADNIDTLLNSCVVVGEELGRELPPRCFFAIGISHLIATPAIPESVVELVAKKGWTVERIVQEKYQLASSRQMTDKEARYLGELIVHMRRHRLYASQKYCLDHS